MTGNMCRIRDWFLIPMLDQITPTYTRKEWLEFLFGIPDRTITEYIAKEDIYMRGGFYQTATRVVSDLGNRKVRSGSRLLIRKDTMFPFWDVQCQAGTGNQDQVFRLNETDWRWLKRRIRKI